MSIVSLKMSMYLPFTFKMLVPKTECHVLFRIHVKFSLFNKYLFYGDLNCVYDPVSIHQLKIFLTILFKALINLVINNFTIVRTSVPFQTFMTVK
jgi:hypothetical protein